MNPKPVSGFTCGKCRRLWDTHEKAEKCCEEVLCPGCGISIGEYVGDKYQKYLYRCKCERIKYVNSLPVIKYEDTEFDGVFDPVSFDFYHDIDDFLGSFETLNHGDTFRVFPAKKKLFEFEIKPRLIEEYISDQLNAFYEGCEEFYFSLDEIVDLEELQEYLKKWSAKQNIYYFVPDETKAIEVKYKETES